MLVLDEPTNDLDIETLELLEQLLQDYPGTLFLVSHDRAFLDNVVTQTIASEGDGVWREYAGGYEDWALAKSRQAAAQADEERAAKRNGSEKPATPPAASEKKAEREGGKRKLSFKETRELAELPGKIAALEDEQKAIAARLEDPALYQGAPLEAQQLSERMAAIDEELLLLLERWAELE